MQAYLERRTTPPIAAIINQYRYGVQLGERRLGAWTVNDSGALVPGHQDLDDRVRQTIDAGPLGTTDWFEHVWVFTAASFVLILDDLRRWGLIDLDLVDIKPTGHMDFIAVLCRPDSTLPRLPPEQALHQLEAACYREVSRNIKGLEVRALDPIGAGNRE